MFWYFIIVVYMLLKYRMFLIYYLMVIILDEIGDSNIFLIVVGKIINYCFVMV